MSERFASAALSNERVLLIDDVITSGGQAEECRRQMLARGASRVVVLALGVTQDEAATRLPRVRWLPAPNHHGPRGDFIGCSNFYRGCRYTEAAPSV